MCALKDSDLIYLKKAAIFGSGAFGTALSCVLAKKCDHVDVWHMKEEEAQLINKKRENVLFLKGVPLADNINYSSDVEKVFQSAHLIVFVIPTQFLRGFLSIHGATMWEYVSKEHVPIVMCSKGIERSSLKFPAQILGDFFPNYPVSVLAGPSFAIEVATGMLTQVCIASNDIYEARTLQRIFTSPDRMFRCWATTDTVGCEVASAMKNVLAIASGVAAGLGHGLNARAALISRGLLEIRDLTIALGGNGEAVFGLAGLGDLLLTCSSELSRNFSVGKKLGEGMTIEEIKRTAKAVAEGVATAEPLYRVAQAAKVNMPICEQVNRVIYEKKSAKGAVLELANGPLFDEGLPALFPTMQAKL